MFIASRERMDALWTPGLVDEKWLLLNNYPLPSVTEWQTEMVKAAERFGYKCVYPAGTEPIGIQDSLNAFFAMHPQPPGTIWVNCDADSLPTTHGWDKAICEVVDAGYPLVGLHIPETPDGAESLVAGHRVFVHPNIMMFNVAGYDLDFCLDECGGFDQPVKYWGGFEGHFLSGLMKTDKHLAFLLDHPEVRDPALTAMHDPRYSAYKWEHFYGRFTGSFADYLRWPDMTTEIRPYPLD